MNRIQSGKGSKRRPMVITLEELSENWDSIFGKKENKIVEPEKPKELINKDVISYE